MKLSGNILSSHTKFMSVSRDGNLEKPCILGALQLYILLTCTHLSFLSATVCHSGSCFHDVKGRTKNQ